MVTGSPIERPLLEWIRGQLPPNVRNRVAFYTDFELPELAAGDCPLQTALTVSSTGPMHMAGVLGTPVVALFSPHPAHVPAKWRPLGENHTMLVAPLPDGRRPARAAASGHGRDGPHSRRASARGQPAIRPDVPSSGRGRGRPARASAAAVPTQAA